MDQHTHTSAVSSGVLINDNALRLPRDWVRHIYSFLSLRDILDAAAVSHYWHDNYVFSNDDTRSRTVKLVML